MAEHQLLSKIYDIINDLAKPQNEGKSMMIYRMPEKPISCLRDLSDGKRLARLLRRNSSNSTKAKQSLTDIAYAYFDLRDYRFRTEQIANIIDNWTDNQMLNFIVVYMKYIVEFKLYIRTTLERLRHEFQCITDYFDQAFDNCAKMIGGCDFSPLIDLKFFESESSESDGLKFTQLTVKNDSIGTPVSFAYSYSFLMSDDDADGLPDPRHDYDDIIDSVIRKYCVSGDEESQLNVESEMKCSRKQCSNDKIERLENGNYECGVCKKNFPTYKSVTCHIGGRKRGLYSMKTKKQKPNTQPFDLKRFNFQLRPITSGPISENVCESKQEINHQFLSTETRANNPTKVCSETQTVIIEQKPSATQTIGDTKKLADKCLQTQTDIKPLITLSAETQTAICDQMICSETQTENVPEIEITLVTQNGNDITDNEDDECEIIFESSSTSEQKLNINANHLTASIKRESDLEQQQNNNNAIVCVNGSTSNDNPSNSALNSSDLVEKSYSKLSESQQNLIENQAFLLGMLRNQLNDYERRDHQNRERINALENLIQTCNDFPNDNMSDIFNNIDNDGMDDE